MKKHLSLFVLLLAILMLVACSLPPVEPVTRRELMGTQIYNRFVIDESPEELLYSLNTRGEVVIESKRNIKGSNFLVYVKLLATTDGVHVLEYDR
ncbi:MAG: hypothetical protein OET90_10715 [Desulfuromonadales bacterium]|nr:hypothetical protein [Desulfuromonadales bacterium]